MKYDGECRLTSFLEVDETFLSMSMSGHTCGSRRKFVHTVGKKRPLLDLLTESYKHWLTIEYTERWSCFVISIMERSNDTCWRILRHGCSQWHEGDTELSNAFDGVIKKMNR